MAIRVLPANVAAMIAAGEVVERPSSVVKELIENAIDAGATKIDVSVRGSNHGTLTISDNGAGMPPEDLALALQRHATSKMDHDRLSMVTTLGFRGEALPSIAAVAFVRVTSRPPGQDVAFSVSQSYGGPMQAPRPCAGGHGTRIEVDGLFDNHPARLKFLKSAKTERAWIRYVVERSALANPHVAFSLQFSNGEPVRFRGQQSLEQRIDDVFGDPLRSDGLSVDHGRDGVSVRGVVTMPSAMEKAGSSTVEFFVNGRHVTDRSLHAALQQPYRELTGTEGFPHAVIMIDLPPSEIDINVHPRKSEVRFFDRPLISTVLSEAIAAALHGAGLRSPGSIAGLAKSLAARQDINVDDPRRLPLGRYIGQANGSWLVAETIDGLVIIDQHAAHERVILERLKEASSDLCETVVRLPTAVLKPCSDFDAAAVEEYADVFSTMGFALAVRARSVSLLSYPSVLSSCDPVELLEMLVANAIRGTASGMMREAMWEMLATAACKAAIKAGHELTPDRAEALLREIERTPSASHCNHGRPTVAFLNNADLGKLFERS